MQNLEKKIKQIISGNPGLVRESEHHRPGEKYIKLNGKRIYFTQGKIKVTSIYRRECFHEKFSRKAKKFFQDSWHCLDFLTPKALTVIAFSALLLCLNFVGLERMKNKISEIRSSHSNLHLYSNLNTPNLNAPNLMRPRIGGYETERIPYEIERLARESISSPVLSNFFSSETIQQSTETALLRHGTVTVSGNRHTSYNVNEPFNATIKLTSAGAEVRITRDRPGCGIVVESYMADKNSISRGISGFAEAGNKVEWNRPQGDNRILGHKKIKMDSAGHVQVVDK